MLDVIERARRYVSKCPVAVSGSGGHNATFHVAALLVHGFALGDADALGLLREWNAKCLPPWSEAELQHKVRSAANAQHAEPRGWLLGDSCLPPRGGTPVRLQLAPAKPSFSPIVLKRVAAKVSGIPNVSRFLSEQSPVAVAHVTSTGVLTKLYPVETAEKILIFSDMCSQGQMLWDAAKGNAIPESLLPNGPEGVWFLPQPVSGQFHSNPRLGGKLSRRSEEAVTAWRYMVLESDRAEADDWLRCLIQMPLRIASICESGGRSIHALVRIDAQSKADWDAKVSAMKPALVTLGADAGALSAVRLTRLPQARRGERMQRLLYLDPAAKPGPIFGGRTKGTH